MPYSLEWYRRVTSEDFVITREQFQKHLEKGLKLYFDQNHGTEMKYKIMETVTGKLNPEALQGECERKQRARLKLMEQALPKQELGDYLKKYKSN